MTITWAVNLEWSAVTLHLSSSHRPRWERQRHISSCTKGSWLVLFDLRFHLALKKQQNHRTQLQEFLSSTLYFNEERVPSTACYSRVVILVYTQWQGKNEEWRIVLWKRLNRLNVLHLVKKWSLNSWRIGRSWCCAFQSTRYCMYVRAVRDSDEPLLPATYCDRTEYRAGAKRHI